MGWDTLPREDYGHVNRLGLSGLNPRIPHVGEAYFTET
jgi:hypothetical protein